MRRKLLVVGGYGAVGTELCRLLAKEPGIELVVAGRSEEKARALAQELDARHCVVDVEKPEGALDDVAGVASCWVDPTAPSTTLPEACAARGLFYLDLAGVPVSYTERFRELDAPAKASGATLVTALGCNPGIPGLLALSNEAILDRVDGIDFYFCLGSKLEGLSAGSMQGVGIMLRTPALVWRDDRWQAPKGGSRARQVGPPFDRKVYYGPAMVTGDLEGVPRRLGARHLAFWSGIEETLQGMMFVLGIKLGQAATPARSERFLRWLRGAASRTASEDTLLEMVVSGQRGGAAVERRVSMRATEHFLTAVAPAIVCRLWARGEITKHGAFVPPDVVPADAFVAELARESIHLTDTMAPAGGST